MTQTQKIIKYLALALAFFIIFSIISMIMYGFIFFSNLFSNDMSKKLEELKITDSASILDIEVSSVNIIIKEGFPLKVETNNDNIKIEEDGNKLFIKEEKHNWFEHNFDLVIYVPNNFIFDTVSIESGAGKIDIDYLSTRNLDFELGAGKVNINKLNVINSASIEGGAGKLSILSGEINNFDLDMGVGELIFTSKLTGNSEINTGIGNVNINLIGDDYKININKGLGTTKINDVDAKDGSTYGNGTNLVTIDGGIGNVKVSYGN